ncbi:MAG: YggS family pyridoxal phosphate-dependent enzyme [Pseudomonadota bacterium]
MTSVTANLEQVWSRIHRAAQRVGRDPAQITLVAVAKRHPASAIRALAAAGHVDFAESYAQEADTKLRTLDDLGHLRWHFIGRLQRNKTAMVAQRFDWVHGIDRAVLAERLSAQRPSDRGPLQVCLQVDFTGGQEGRSGVAPQSLPALAEQVASLPQLHLRGLMTLPPPESEFERQREHFRHLEELRQELNHRGFGLDVLSAGMSGDLEAAVAEGATHVRIGTALFGARPAS